MYCGNLFSLFLWNFSIGDVLWKSTHGCCWTDRGECVINHFYINILSLTLNIFIDNWICMLQIVMISATKLQGKRYVWEHAMIVGKYPIVSHQAQLGIYICVLAMDLSPHMMKNSSVYRYMPHHWFHKLYICML